LSATNYKANLECYTETLAKQSNSSQVRVVSACAAVSPSTAAAFPFGLLGCFN